MIKKELELMLGGGLIDVALSDEEYDMAIKLAEEIYPYKLNPREHRRLAFAECLTMIGLSFVKFASSAHASNDGKAYLELAKYWRDKLTT